MPLLDPIPSPVAHADRHALEWEPLLALVSTFASSPVGRVAIVDLQPSTDEGWITRQHQLTGEVRLLLEEQVSIPLGGLFDPTQLAAKAQIPEAALEAAELQSIARIAHDIAAWQSLLREPSARLAGKLPGLSELSATLTISLRPLAESIERKILPDGSLADDASPELHRIRREQERQQRVIEESLRSALRRLSGEGATQDELITIRGDRFVIPVRSELKRRVSGVVHGASSSGQTVYVEPLETIEQNNELVRLLEEEQAEIHRIFVALTRQVGGYATALVDGARVLALVDSLQARARFARNYDCAAPTISADRLHIEGARHPLLEKRLRAQGAKQNTAVVPLTLELTREHRQLIISGPNTGGKTVTLKTVALLSMMAQAGIPVPAGAASFPIFDAFLADIGDAQSIEEALSTFSAHITNLDRLARLADQNSLVLLDELGSATDPEEGSALAVAVAQFFLDAGAWSLISTHHTSLKVYGANTAGVLNAAAGVDEVTLVPNYQLRLGVPGASAGIATAERLGLNAKIIAGARQRLGSQQVDIARFLDRLHSELAELDESKKKTRAEQYLLNQQRARLDREGDVEIRNRVRDLEKKLDSLMKEFEFQMRENVKAIEDRAAQQKLSKEAERRIIRMRREFQESFNQTVVAHRTGADQGDANAQPHIVRHISAGDQVRLKSMGGKIAAIQREVEKDVFEVALGPIKMRVKRDDIAEVVKSAQPQTAERADPLAAARRTKGVHVSVIPANSDDMRMEINLIGRTVDEATDELEKYLDRAFLAGLPRVRVIHGHGAGILRRGVRDFLKSHPHVATIAEAPQNEGGQGATVVELRQ
ncbi:endonuclease MutS2 [Occallatibacter riparius]|uniref:Endonuclease MutS2 n=1 Tax=Occallatibacter riparius TaxID=1002689 RepID=A0A9J7BPR5_9BACT|nr:endonuclease MutS2 [Occallatibacter riparius]UWZ84521.1 endonuclease MutS2 [Occallatibacter riparius]